MADDYAASNPDEKHMEGGDSLVPPQPQDNAAPFSTLTDPVDDAASDLDVRQESGQLDPTHQAADNATDIDSHQLYDEGLAGAAEASEPNAGNTVVRYDPEKDQRMQSEQ